MRVLSIEDHQPTVVILRKLCANLEVVAVGSLTEARAELAAAGIGAGSFDVLLVDLNLPDSMGMDTVRALMEYDYPLVVLTGDPSEAFRAEAWRLGVADYIDKGHLLEPYIDLPGKLAAAHENYERIKRRYERSVSFVGLDSVRPYITCPPFASLCRSVTSPHFSA